MVRLRPVLLAVGVALTLTGLLWIAIGWCDVQAVDPMLRNGLVAVWALLGILVAIAAVILIVGFGALDHGAQHIGHLANLHHCGARTE